MMSVCLSVCLWVCVCLSIGLNVCPFVCLCVRLLVCPSSSLLLFLFTSLNSCFPFAYLQSFHVINLSFFFSSHSLLIFPSCPSFFFLPFFLDKLATLNNETPTLYSFLSKKTITSVKQLFTWHILVDMVRNTMWQSRTDQTVWAGVSGCWVQVWSCCQGS